MKKLKLLNRFKTKKEKDVVETEITVENKELPKPEIKEETEEIPVKEYRETLYSRGEAPKKPTITPKPIEKQWTGRRWEKVEVIEKNVDYIDKRKSEYQEKKLTKSDINTKVDRLISKRKK